jgi:hypothetical protein
VPRAVVAQVGLKGNDDLDGQLQHVGSDHHAALGNGLSQVENQVIQCRYHCTVDILPLETLRNQLEQQILYGQACTGEWAP